MRTSKELAKELGVSAQTIRNEANNQDIVPTRQGKFFYFVDDDAERIRAAILERRTDKETSKKEQSTKQTNDFVKALQMELKDKNDRIEKLENEKAFLMKQLEDVTTSLKAAQVIAQTATLRIPQHDDRTWWQRLFGIQKKTDTDSQGEV